ncbi:MAG TPA: EAL domain-containing protein, partial [Clostridiales bacterium]|nr:EAL domain-containing protein [Clostridiales bacterium]
MTNRLFKSLENEEFFLEFQPQISCNTGKTSGIEALLRWTSDGTRRVPPDKFIPILEQTGLIYDVGLWVLEQTLQEHNRLIAKGFPPLRVSVNLSVVQFQEEEFISDVRKIIGESGVDPKYIELEITESLFSKDPEDVMKKLHQLKGLGVSIAIDDFGKGYSSLNRLKRVPFDRLKIDKEIIDYIDAEREKAPITEIVIQLGKAFRAAITAEGVETKGQADFLRNAACDEIQGYYYSKPLSPAALEEFLKEE